MKKLLVGCIVAFSAVYAIRGCADGSEDQQLAGETVLLISIDGFRWDYLDRYPTTHISRLIDEGVRAEALIPAHPTKTFPNHYTIVTGLFPSNHGIVANVMYDPVFDETFSMSKREEVENARWWEGEPLWVTAEKQGVRAATYFWPGSEAPIQGQRPTFWKRYDGSIPGRQRVDEVLGWLDLPAEERPRFVTLYFSDVDSKGHDHGPNAEEVAEAVHRVDDYIGRLIRGLEARDAYDNTNIVLVSDHGMAEADEERVIFLDDYVQRRDFYLIESSPILMINPKQGRGDKVFRDLAAAHPALTVYRKSEYPKSWHWEGHRRLPAMVAVADEGWSIITSREAFESGEESIIPGTHGYAQGTPSMNAIFVARGPAFIEGERVEAFENIHVYPLITHLLGVEPARVDGSFGKVHHLLKKDYQ